MAFPSSPLTETPYAFLGEAGLGEVAAGRGGGQAVTWLVGEPGAQAILGRDDLGRFHVLARGVGDL